MPCMGRHLPTEIPHDFRPNDWQADDADPICIALLHTAVPHRHGFSHHAQCGHPKSDHPTETE